MKHILMQIDADSDGELFITVNDYIAHLPTPAIVELYELVGDRLHLDAQALKAVHAEGRTVGMHQVAVSPERETGH